ncbi:hypothetical protein QR680_017753 [Steinernema hermaphroditum]|uniref:Fucosyltransferase n=1 Tax=Steinernema hermaphroditum TaxID=289476 RepID=A0AA39LPN9_9BILA|nr:hypothetical protein QR680_017753 [Steinernema hermaphroditum]
MALRYRTWSRIRRFGSLGISFFALSLLLFFWSLKKHKDYWAEREVADYYEKHPVILSWTRWFGESLSAELTRFDSRYPCEYRCTFTDDRRLLKYAKALVFHDKDINIADLPPVDRSKINVYYNMESPDYSEKAFYALPMDFFQWTLTYRQESTVWKPFDKMEEIEKLTEEWERWTEEEVLERMKLKKKEVLQFVSKCKSKSQREDYTAHLQKHINVTVIGKCAQDSAPCERYSECEGENIASHYFYLAFEDSVCVDFVTEKAFLLKDLIVPVVLSYRAINSQLLEGSYIAADDYLGPEDLAKRLKYLIAHKEEYMEHFEWTRKYKRSKAVSRHSCEICEALLKGRQFPEEKDIHGWWKRDAHCEEQNFVVRLGVPQPPPPLVKKLRPFYGDDDYERI